MTSAQTTSQALGRSLAGRPSDMKRVIIESPYAGNIEHNVAYARACMAHSIHKGEAPIASHLIYTQPGILRDEVPEERKRGIEAGFAWRAVAELSAFYTDRGWSSGMLAALHTALRIEHPISIRALFNLPRLPATLDEDIEQYLRSCTEV